MTLPRPKPSLAAIGFGTFVAFALLVAVACSGSKNSDSAVGGDSPCVTGPVINPQIPEAAPVGEPTTGKPDSLKTKWPIKHVVFIMKENRSFDQLFGAFPGANGASSGMDGKTEVPLKNCIPQKLKTDLIHDYPTALASWDHGKMDGFATSPYARKAAYSRAAPSDIPNYWRWATDFTLSDNFFASAMGPSYPNHLFSISAQSAGTHDNPVENNLGPDYTKRAARGLAKSWGCDLPKDAYVIVNAGGKEHKQFPCWDIPTMGDRLNQAKIPWAYYGATPRQNGYIWSAYSYIRHMRLTSQWQQHVFPVQQLVSDINGNRLPPVTWVTPEFWLSDHPDANICEGENWTTTVIDTLMRSPEWKNTAVFLSWDDWGGFYDHVAPKQIDGFGLGFRVPLIMMSPYAKKGYIDHTPGEFSSVLRFMEENWGTPPLTKRDAHAGSLSELFDFSQSPRGGEPLPLRTDCRMSPPTAG